MTGPQQAGDAPTQRTRSEYWHRSGRALGHVTTTGKLLNVRRACTVGALALLLTTAFAAPASAAQPAITEYAAGIPAGAAPNGITPGPDGAMWFTERNANALGRIAPNGTTTQYPSSGNPLSAGADPAGIVTGPDGNIYFTEYGTSAIGELDPTTGQLVGEYPTPSLGAGPDGIAVGPDGGIWFTEQSSGSEIGRLDPSTHAITEYRVKSGSNENYKPTDIVTGPDGKLWITLLGTGQVAQLNTGLASPDTDDGFTLYDLPTSGSTTEPEGIVSAPNGDLYVAEYGAGKIAKIVPASVSAGTDDGITEFPAGGQPLWLSNAGDGAIWATDNTGDQLLRFDLSTDSSQAFGSAQGVTGDPTTDAQDAGGNLWFTLFDANQVGEVATATPSPSPAAPGAPVNIGAPAISESSPGLGATLTCSNGTWSNDPTAFALKWLLDGQAIAGQTASSFTVTSADIGHPVTCAVTASNAGGSATATSAAVTPLLAPLPPATLRTGGTVRSGTALVLQAGGGGSQVTRYSYAFANGAVATCTGSRPVLSAVFDGATSGVAKLTETSTSGASTSTTVSYSVTTRPLKRAHAADDVATRLIGYACSQTAAAAPQNTLLNQRNQCSATASPTEEDGGYVSMIGSCISEVPLSSLSKDDRDEIPFANHGRFEHGFVPSTDTTDDTYFASYGAVRVNGLTITPSSGHAVILVEGGGSSRRSSDSILQNPNGYYLVSGGATATVTAPDSDRQLQLTATDQPISWNVSSSTNANGKPQAGSTAKLTDVKLSNIASGIPGIGWLAAQVIQTADVDQTLTSIGFAIAGDGTYVTNLPIDITNLPFGDDASADVVVQADNVDGLQLGEFTLTIPDVFVGPIEFQNVDVQYTRDGTQSPAACKGVSTQQANSLIGCAQAVIAAGLVSGTMVISDVSGKPSLSYFHIDYVGNLALFGTPVTLTKFSGDLDPSTDSLNLNAHLSVFGGGVVNGCGLAGAYGKATLTFSPFLFDAAGNVELLCVQLPQAPSVYLHVDGNGYLSEGTYFDADLDVIKLSGQETGNAYLDFADGKFHVRFDGDLNASADFGFGTLSVGANTVISDVGLAACTEIDTPWHNYEAGFGTKYNLTDLFSSPGGAFTYLANNLSFYADGCDVNNYSVIPAAATPAAATPAAATPAAATPAAATPAAATPAAQADSYGLTIPAGQKNTIVLLSGPLGAPGAILHGPGGRTIDASKAGEIAASRTLVMHLGAATEVQMFDAAPGKWTIDPAPGTPPITSAKTSHDLGSPSVKGRVSGTGSDRVLHYRIRNLPSGAPVSFVENGSNGGKLLGVAHGSTGTLKFSPSEATGRARTILAEPTGADGSPLPTIKVTSYRASPPTPGRPGHVRVRRHGTTLVITFSPSAGAAMQLVSVRLSDGVRQALVLSARARSFRISGIPRGIHAAPIAIRGRSADGVLGPVGRGQGG
jgi:streptogramin lyase